MPASVSTNRVIVIVGLAPSGETLIARYSAPAPALDGDPAGPGQPPVALAVIEAPQRGSDHRRLPSEVGGGGCGARGFEAADGGGFWSS